MRQAMGSGLRRWYQATCWTLTLALTVLGHPAQADAGDERHRDRRAGSHASVVSALPETAVVIPAGRVPVPTADRSAVQPAALRTRAGLLHVAAGRLATSGTTVLTGGDTSESALEGSWADVLALGDLDGDSRADVGVVDITLPEQTLTLRALRGRDAEQLWSLPLDGAGVLVTRRDLTGDTAADFIRFAIPRYDVLIEDCPPERSNCVHFLAEFDWEVQVLSGRTLAPSWTATFAGRVEEQERVEVTPLGRTTTYHQEIRTGWVLPHVVAAPGGGAVLLSSFDLDERSEQHDATVPLAFEDHYSEELRTTHRVAIRRAADGEPLATTTFGPIAGQATVEPIPDVDGDGFDEVIVEQRLRTDTSLSCTDAVLVRRCAGAAPASDHVVMLLDGRRLEERWSSASGGLSGAGTALQVDVNGDGVQDVTHRWTSGTGTNTAVLSGADGGALWSATGAETMFGLGDINGDGLDDVLQAIVSQSATDTTIELLRLDGGSGSLLGHTSHRFGEDGEPELGYVYLTSDHDADGSRDVIVGRVSYAGQMPTSAALLEAGGSRDRLWEVDGTGARVLRRLGELDGDALPEYDWSVIAAAPPSTVVTVSVLRGYDGTMLWKRAVDAEFGYTADAGDLDAAGVQDIAIVYDRQEAGRWHSEVMAVRGHDGQERWTVRSLP